MWSNRLFYLLGASILILGAIELIPLILAVLSGDVDTIGPFLTSVLLTILVGGSLFLGFQGAPPVRTPALTVLLPFSVILCLAIVAGLPFFFMYPDDGFAPALFEGMSFLTTSGASAYPLGSASPVVELWRALVAWAGGFMAIIYSLSIITALNSGGQQLHTSSLPFGDSREGYTRLYSTSIALFPLYTLVTVVFSLLFLMQGLPLFPAFLMAIGGVSTTSLPGYLGWIADAPLVQISFFLLMLIGAGNWDMLSAFLEGKKRSLLRDPESRTMMVVLGISLIALSVAAITSGDGTIWSAVFHTVSAMSGTAVSLSGEHAPPTANVAFGVIFLCLVVVGGGSIGTTGGLRHLRVLALTTLGRAELDRLAYPNGMRTLAVGRSPLTPRDRDAVYLLIGGFFISFVLGTLLLGIQGVSFRDSMALTLSALSLAGPASEFMVPDALGYTALTNSDYLILSGLMLIGRLEVTVFLALFTHSLWRR